MDNRLSIYGHIGRPQRSAISTKTKLNAQFVFRLLLWYQILTTESSTI
jgi:hypothetical protein